VTSLAPWLAVAVAVAALAELLLRRRADAAERARLAAELRALAARVEAAERTAADAHARAETTAAVLVEKGLAEEEDLASSAPPDGGRGPDGSVH
jgi:hypothetical protein